MTSTTMSHSLDSCNLSSFKQKIAKICCCLLLVQVVFAHDSRGHHSRIARSIKSHKERRDTRVTKFSDLGPIAKREHDKSIAKIKGVYIGLILDAGDTGGQAQTMEEVTKSLRHKTPALYGWYAQVTDKKPFDGSQLLEVKDDVKKCNCVFAPAIMPKDGWGGLNAKDNSQAVRIAKVLRKFTDDGIPVILRFGHEANWYQHTGEYPGNAGDFKTGYIVVAKAVRYYCPECLLHWSPNVDIMKKYVEYALKPEDMDAYVDYVGFDWYPTHKPQSGEFVAKATEFYNKFAVNGRQFALGEAGLHYDASMRDRVDWLTQMAASKEHFPNLAFIIWYNCKKEWNYKIAGNGVSTALLTEKLE